MPIPVLSEQQVPQAIVQPPQVDQRSLMYRLPGAMGEGFGQDLAAAAQGIAGMVHQANQTRVEDAINSQVRPFQQNLLQGYQARTGINALVGDQVPGNPDSGRASDDQAGQALPDQVMGQFDQHLQQVRSGLSNPAQQAMFDQAAMRLRLEAQGQIQAHATQQATVYQDQTNRATIGTEVNHVGAVGVVNGQIDPGTIQQSLARVNAAVDAQAQLHGWSPEMTAAQRLDSASQLHATVLGSLLAQHNPQGAQVYFQDHRDQIDPAVAQKMDSMIQANVTNQKADAAVDQVWNTQGPKVDGDPVNLDQMSDTLRSQFQNDPTGLKLAMSGLKERAQEHDYAAKQREEGITGGLWQQVLHGSSLSGIKASPQYMQLDGTAQVKFITQAEAFQKRNDNQPDNNMAHFAEYWALASNPEALKGMTDAQIFAKAPVMGPQLVKKLLQDKQDYLNAPPGKTLPATVDTDAFKAIAGQAGLPVFSKTPEDQGTMGMLKFRTEQAIDAEQQARGRALTRDEKDQITRRLVAPVTIQTPRSWYNPAGWFGSPLSTDQKPLFEAEPSDADLATVRKSLAAAGIANPTDSQLHYGYYALKAGK